MRIKIKKDEGLMKIEFLKSSTVLFDITFPIVNLTDEEIIELKKEATVRFCEKYPEIERKVVLKSFSIYDDEMKPYYRENFPLGGSRGGGRPKRKKD